MAAHPGFSAQDIIRWYAMEPKKIKWLPLAKHISEIALDNDSPIAIQKMYRDLGMLIESCHDGVTSILPDLATLKPSNSFAARILPPSTFDGYGKARAFYMKLANTLCAMFENRTFAAKAPAVRQGLRFVASSEADVFVMMFTMLKYTMPHLGALGFNPQKLIDALILMNGDDVYEFMAKAIQVEESIAATHMIPPPNALLTQVLDQLNKSPDHRSAISSIKQDFVLFIRQHTSTKQYHTHTPMTIQCHLLALDAPCLAVIAGAAPINPSTTRTLIHDAPLSRITSAT